MSSQAAGIFPTERAAVTRTVESFDTTRIVYDLYEHSSRTAVLVVPGFWRERRHPAMVALGHALHRRGYRTAVMDPRGHGDSGGRYGFNLHEYRDTAAVADDLLKLPGIESVALVGFSYGGAIAISTAARHKLPISSVVLISPVADFAMIVPRINPFTIHRHITFAQAFRRPKFEWRARHTPKLRALDDIAGVRAPICFVHVKNDWLIAHTHSVALYEAANEPKELHLIDIPGNYHADRIFSVAPQSVEPVVFEFLRRYSPV